MRFSAFFVTLIWLLIKTSEIRSWEIVCPSEREQFIPHPMDCSRYFLCVDGDALELPCPKDWIFDNIQLRCVPVNGRCSTLEGPTESPIDNSTTASPPNSTVTTLSPNSTTFVTTLAPNSTFATTPSPNTTFFTTLSPNSTLAPNVTEAPSPITCPPAREQYVPHPTDCTRYYLCVDGEPFELPCPTGWLFDSVELRCLPMGAKCFNGNNSTTTLSPNSTTTLSPNSTTTLSPNSTTTLSPNSSTPNTTPVPLTTTQTPIICPDRGEAFIPHPEYCNKYFLCVDGNPRELDCPTNWIFDFIQLRCLPVDGQCVLTRSYAVKLL